MSQKFELPLFYGSPTTEAVGSNFVTSAEPTTLVVGARTKIRSQFDRMTFDTASYNTFAPSGGELTQQDLKAGDSPS